MKDLTDKARELATLAHDGQQRRDGRPYIEHPEKVAQIISDLSDDPERVQAAWLHDVLEDTTVGVGVLREQGFSERTIKIVKTLTHKKSESYMDYIARVGQDPDALPIKLADIICNLSDGPTERQKRKYLMALLHLCRN